jgi:hypothetical protein
VEERRIARDPLRSPGSLVRAHPDGAALLVLLVACVGYAALFFGAATAIDMDAGRDFLVADLMVQGRVLYRDVDYRFGPFPPWLHAALFRCFGTGTTVLFAAGAVASSVIVLLTYLLARQVLPLAPAVVAALIVLQNAAYGSHYFIYAVPYTFSAVYGLLFSLLVLYGALVVMDDGDTRWDWVTGAAAALAAASKLEFAAISILVLLFSLVVRSRVAPRSIRRALVACAVSYTLVMLGIAVWLFRTISWSEFLESVYPRDAVRSWRYFYQTTQYWGPNVWTGVWRSTAGFLMNLGFVLAATWAVLLAASWTRGRRPALSTLLILAAGLPFIWLRRGLAYYPLLLHGTVLGLVLAGRIRASPIKIGFLTGSAVLFLMRVLPGPMTERFGSTFMFFIPSLIVYLYLCCEVAAAFSRRFFPGMSAPMAVTAVFLCAFVLAPLARVTYPWVRQTEQVLTERGPIRVSRLDLVKTRIVLEQIRCRTAPGDRVLLLPFDSMYYFLTGRQPASRWTDYIAGHLQGGSEQEEILRLSRTPPKLVIIDDLPQPQYFPGPNNRLGTAYNVEMNRWIWQHYREVERFPLTGRWLHVLVASGSAASDGSGAMKCGPEPPSPHRSEVTHSA